MGVVWAGTGSCERWKFNPPVAGQPLPAAGWIWGVLGGARAVAGPERVGRACERVSARARVFAVETLDPPQVRPGIPGCEI